MYIKGQSRQEAREKIGEKTFKSYESFQPANSPDVRDFGISPDVKPLQTHHHIIIWGGELVKNARLLDEKLDELYNQLIPRSDSCLSRKKVLKNILKSLFQLKDPVRCLEIDIEEFLQVLSITDHKLDSSLGTIVFEALSQVNNTYKNVYDLVIFKLKNISNSRVTVTNICLSLVAILISIVAFIYK